MPALELALESKFRESGDSPMPFELSWIPGGSVGFLINLFGFFELTMVVVRGRKVVTQHMPVTLKALSVRNVVVLTELRTTGSWLGVVRLTLFFFFF